MCSSDLNLTGQDQGAGYLSLIKKGTENTEGGVIEEYLYLQYGYKFPESMSEEIIRAEDRYFFEEQEKKELVIKCFKHDFRFSESGEVTLNVSYYAYPDHALFSRSEEKTNDVFLITNKSVIDEMLDEPSEDELKAGLSIELKLKIESLKERNDLRKELIKNYCRDKELEKKIKLIDNIFVDKLITLVFIICKRSYAITI